MKVYLIAAFGFKNNDSGGQPIKSRELYNAILQRYGKNNVFYTDTVGWKRKPFSFFCEIIKKGKKADSIIMLPAHNGVRVFSFVLKYFKKKYSKKIYYDVIGGWLPDLVSKKKYLINNLKAFDGIWVETNTMKKKLLKYGITTIVIPNFKNLIPVNLDNKIYAKPYRVCMFSRVTKSKGISDAINAVSIINQNENTYLLDIYGIIEPNYESEFKELLSKHKAFVSYKGCVNQSDSTKVLKDYFFLLFPTRHYTEGIPGTIIDSYFSGVPVISSRWESFEDVIVEGKTGIGFEFNNFNSLLDVLHYAFENPNDIISMKHDCIIEAANYSVDNALNLMGLNDGANNL